MRVFEGWTTANRAVLGLFALSVLLCAAEAVGARWIDPLPEADAASAVAPMPKIDRRNDPGETVVLAAVARDPFRPDRKRPAGRYRMPGEAVQAPVIPDAPVYTPPAPTYSFRVLGTVVLEGGGLAAIAGQTGESRVLRVGQSMDGFRLARVGPGTATLVGQDTTLVLKVAGSEGAGRP